MDLGRPRFTKEATWPERLGTVWQEVCREVAGRGGLLIQRGLGVRGARLLDFRLRDSPVRH